MKEAGKIHAITIMMLIIFSAADVAAQSSWTEITMNDIINQMKSDNVGDIYAVGERVYRSTDDGNTWTAVVTGLPSSLSIGITQNNTLLAGTFYNGIFRSTNKGASWEKVDSTSGNVWGFVTDNSGNVFAASNLGIFKSTNDGVGWHQVSSVNSGSIAFDRKSDRIYASFYIDSTQKTTVYASTNAGNSWKPADSGLNNDGASIDIAVGPSGNVFASTLTHGTFRSTDGGNDWISVGNGIGIWNFAFDSTGRIFAAGGSHVYISTDGGITWGCVDRGWQPGWDVRDVLVAGSRVLISWIGTFTNGAYPSGLAYRTDFSTPSFPPDLISPGDNSEGLGQSIQLKWHSGNLASTYRVQVAWSRSMGSSVLYDADNLTDTTVEITRPLDGWHYCWRVRDNNDEGGSPWSYTWQFRSAYPPLISPELSRPSNGSSGVSLEPRLIWSWDEYTAYQIQVATDSNFVGIAYQDSLISYGSISVPMLRRETRYYWHVRAARGDSIGDWSTTWSFTTAAVELLRPSNGAFNVSLAPRLTWNVVPSAAYQIQVATDSNFVGIAYQDSAVSDTSIGVPILQRETKYYWHVRTLMGESTSSWSTTWDFTTGIVVGIKRWSNPRLGTFKLYRNYPNPFNPATTIEFDVPKPAFVSLKVYDLLGRVVSKVFEGSLQPGEYTRSFDGRGLPSGVYFLRMRAPSYSRTIKLLLVK